MLKTITIIGTMFAAIHLGSTIDALAEYQDLLIGLMVALLLTPWLTQQFD